LENIMTLTKVTYSMIAGAVTNVQDFGAVGDGVADDTIPNNSARRTSAYQFKIE
jgi:polygalacturonase